MDEAVHGLVSGGTNVANFRTLLGVSEALLFEDEILAYNLNKAISSVKQRGKIVNN